MKRQLNHIFKHCVIACLCSLVLSCSAFAKESIAIVDVSHHASAQKEDSFTVDQQIFSDDHIDLICKSITRDGILFECKNKTPRDIMFFFDIALDGRLQSMWCDADESTVAAGETKEFMYYSPDALDSTEHETMSIAAMGFVDNTEYLSFDVVNYIIVGKAHPDELASGESVYTSGQVDIEYIGLFPQGIEFKVSNKNHASMSLYIDEVMINGDLNAYGSAFTIPACSEGICRHYITGYVQNMNGDDIKSFTANFKTNLDQLGTVTLCEMSYEQGKVTANKITDLAVNDDAETKSVSVTESKAEAETLAKTESTQSITQDAYEKAIHMTKADLTKSNGKWSYKGLPLLTEDCDWIDDKMNTKGTVEAGAIYRKVEYLLEGFDSKINNGKDYCQMVFGVPFESRDALVPYVENAEKLYKEKYPIVSIMRCFSTLSSVTGDFDFEYGTFGKYDIVIEDTKACAEEMRISEEMLGYTIAMLNEYEAEVVFDGGRCTIKYESYR